MVMRPLAAPDAPEVEAEGGQAVLLQCLGRPEHDLEVHDAALKRVGVADDTGRDGRALGQHEDRFQAARRPGDVETFVHHRTDYVPGATVATRSQRRGNGGSGGARAPQLN